MKEDTKHYLEAELDDLIQTDPEVWKFIREGSLDGVWYWDLENPEDEWMSPEFWRVFGIDPDQKSHHSREWQDLIFEEDLETAKHNLDRHIEDPDHPYDQVVRYRHAQGGTAWVRCRGLAIRNEEGKAIRLLGAHNDVTGLMQTQERLSRSNALLSLVLDSVGIGIVGLDPTGRIILANPAACTFIGEPECNPPFDWPDGLRIFDPSDMSPLGVGERPVDRVIAGEILTGEVVLLQTMADGTNRYVRLTSKSISGKAPDIAHVLMLEDVTEQEINRQTIERTQRLDVLEQLSGGIAHDFNNVLSTVQYSVQLVMNGVPGGKSRRYLNTALKSTLRGAALTRRLMAFAKRQPSHSRHCIVADTMRDLTSLAAPSIEESIELHVLIPDGELTVYCDDQQLESTLLNLVLNSRDAIIRSGMGRRIEISARPVPVIDPDPATDAHHDAAEEDIDGHRFVEFYVTDDGPGMTEEIRRRAIDPFFSTKEDSVGKGLGLSMVYGFVKQHQGHLQIRSDEGSGTTISFTLPRENIFAEGDTGFEHATEHAGRNERVLIVEDEPDLLDMTSALVEGLGYKVESALSGAAALAIVEDGKTFDLLLTDVVMPGGMSGFALAKSLRAKLPTVGVVYMSGYTGFNEDEMRDAVGPIIAKPCSPDELAATLRKSLDEMRGDSGS